jgi:uncharacterized membrane protein HdeD (DUF308 family)
MNDTDTSLGAPGGFSSADFQQNVDWFPALGILLISVGTLAIIYDFMATVISALFFGWILLFMAAFEAVQAFRQTKWGGLFPQPARNSFQACHLGMPQKGASPDKTGFTFNKTRLFNLEALTCTA